MDIKIKITLVFGTRPEGIKLAPLIREFQKNPRFDIRICVTGQHKQMLNQVLEFFEIEPDCNFELMTRNQSLAEITANSLKKITEELTAHRPDIVIVQGDTTTVMAGGLAAFYLGIPVGHVEAGLRSNDIFSPFPEEANRRIVSLFATLNFAPSATSKENLLREGIPDNRIFVTGNTGIDALFWAVQKIRRQNMELPGNIARSGRKMVLITAHRRESFGVGFQEICRAIRHLCIKFPDFDFVYPVHLNPNVRKPVAEILRVEQPSNLILTDPLEYMTFVSMLDHAYLLLTDSGGVQEEAPSLGKPVLVMRENTERPEAVTAGTARLVGNSFEKIVANVTEMLTDENAYRKMANTINPYGNGTACPQIADIILKYFE